MRTIAQVMNFIAGTAAAVPFSRASRPPFAEDVLCQ
jgi:hypothetical protein